MKQRTKKEKMITDILQVCWASNCYLGTDEIFLRLACMTEEQLKQVCAELCIKT